MGHGRLSGLGRLLGFGKGQRDEKPSGSDGAEAPGPERKKRQPPTWEKIDLEHARVGGGSIDLGARLSDERQTEKLVSGVLNSLRIKAKSAYRVEWDIAPLFPACEIDGRKIQGLSHGTIIGPGPTNDMLGTYEHIEPTEGGRNVVLLFFFDKDKKVDNVESGDQG